MIQARTDPSELQVVYASLSCHSSACLRACFFLRTDVCILTKMMMLDTRRTRGGGRTRENHLAAKLLGRDRIHKKTRLKRLQGVIIADWFKPRSAQLASQLVRCGSYCSSIQPGNHRRVSEWKYRQILSISGTTGCTLSA